MRKLLPIGKGVKARRKRVKEILGEDFKSKDLGVRVELIQQLIPLGLMQIGEMLQEEVRELAGDWYQRDGKPGYVRWSREWGSVYLGDQKIPIEYQRVRDKLRGREVELETYRRFQEPRSQDEDVMKKLLYGLSTRSYEDCCALVPEVFGMSPSTLSRRFIRASKKKLKELVERRLDDLDLVVLILDGKTFADDEMIIAMGVTMEGEKKMLGFVQAGTENERVCRELIRDLIGRGLRYEEGLLCIVDGAKGLSSAIRKALKGYALIQRCTFHKRENIVSHLPKSDQEWVRKALQKAYGKKTHEKAEEALLAIREELSSLNESAVRSLDEGFDETLTLHRLGLIEELGRSLKTSNMIESVMSLIGQKTDKVDYWKNSNQKQRWLAAALLEIEPRPGKICGYRYLPLLRKAIKRELHIETKRGKEEEAA